MTPEQKALLTEKLWLNNARRIRPAIAKRIADALNKDVSEICFTNFTQTKKLSELFAEEVGACETVEVANREASIKMVESALDRLPNTLFLLPSRFLDCGTVSINVADLKGRLDEVLTSQSESLRLISPDGKSGVCIICQEKSLPIFPRFVNIWYGDTQDLNVVNS